MRREETLSRLRALRPVLAARGVGALYLYGSVARDEAGEASDIDVLIDPVDEAFSAFDLIALRDLMSTSLGGAVEAHDYDGYLRLPAFRERIGADIVRVF